MQLIFNKEAAMEMADRFTVLELDTINTNGKDTTVYCVVPAENMSLGDLPTLAESIRMHAFLIEQLKNKDYEKCIEALSHLYGKFGGEVDSFYTEIAKRITESADE